MKKRQRIKVKAASSSDFISTGMENVDKREHGVVMKDSRKFIWSGKIKCIIGSLDKTGKTAVESTCIHYKN